MPAVDRNSMATACGVHENTRTERHRHSALSSFKSLNAFSVHYGVQFWLLTVVAATAYSTQEGNAPSATSTIGSAAQYPAIPAGLAEIGYWNSAANTTIVIHAGNINLRKSFNGSTIYENRTTLSATFGESRQAVLRKDLSVDVLGTLSTYSCVAGYLLSKETTYTRFTLKSIKSLAHCQKVCEMLWQGKPKFSYTYNNQSQTCGCLVTTAESLYGAASYLDAAQSNWLTCFIFPNNLIDPRSILGNCTSHLVAPLPDSAITASSYYDQYLVPSCAKLYGASRKCTGYAGSWSTRTLSNPDYLQIDLQAMKTVVGYDLMGRIDAPESQGNNQYVTSFLVHYSTDNINYSLYGTTGKLQIFPGNTDATSLKKGYFPYPLGAVRYLRIEPYRYNNHKSLRIELYGCDSL